MERRGSGPVVFIVPSGKGDCGAYLFLAEKLKGEFTVITFDIPGFSRSSEPPPWDEISADMLGDRAADIVRVLGVDKATFVGSSSGAITAGLFMRGWAVAGAVTRANRVGAEVVCFRDKHSPYISNPDMVADIIRKSAAKAT